MHTTKAKKLLCLVLSLMMILGAAPLTAFAGDEEETFKFFEIYDGILYKYYGNDADVVIPSGVEMIYEEAFAGNTDIVRVTIPDGVQFIYDRAFQGCTSLAIVSIPDSVTKIGSDCFKGCTSLRVTPGHKGADISRGEFADCTSLEMVWIDEGTEEIGSYAFSGCYQIKSFVIPKSLDYSDVFGDAFEWDLISGSSHQKFTFYFPCDMNGEEWVEGWKNYFGYYFEYEISEQHTHDFVADPFDIRGFRKCADCEIPEFEFVDNGTYNLVKINAVGNVVFPDIAVGWIKYPAANGSELITSITFTNDYYPYYEDGIFRDCPNLRTLDYSITDDYSSLDRCTSIFDTDNIEIVFCTCGMYETIRNAFHEYYFQYCEVIPVHDYTYSYTDVDDSTHTGKCVCGEIGYMEGHTYNDGVCVCGDVNIPPHTHVFAEAWSSDANGHWHACTADDCDIEDYAECGLEGAAYGEHTYANGKCTVCDALDPDFTVDENGVLTKYNGAGGDVVLPDTVKAIADNAFCRNDKITSVTGAKVTSIGYQGLNHASNLVSVSFPELTTVGQYAFQDCKKLTTVTAPKLTTVDYMGFSECKALTSITSSAVTTLGDYAFDQCAALASFDASSVTTVGNSAFGYTSALKSIEMPKVTTMGSTVFTGSGVKSILLTDSVKTVQSNSLPDRMTVNYPCDTDIDALKEGLKNAYKPNFVQLPHSFEDGICTLCGADEAEVLLAEAKTTASAEINALAGVDDSDEVKAIIENALADIEAAETAAAVEAIAAAAEADVAAQKAAEEAAAALAAAKTEAKATVNALAEGASDAVKAIVDKAVEDIEAAANESAVASIVSNAKNKVNAQKNFESVLATKKAELSAALAEAKCDEAKEILTKALEDLDNVTDLNSVYSISGAAIGTAKGKDGDYTGRLNAYKNAFILSLTDNSLAAADNYLDYIIPALENTTSVAALIELFNAEQPKIEFYCGKERAATRYDNLLEVDGITDETKALMAEAAEKIIATTTVEDFKKVTAEYDAKVQLAAVKDNTIFALNEFVATADDSAAVTAIIEKAIADIKAADSQEAVSVIMSDAATAVEAQRQAEAEAAAALEEAKPAAKAAVEALASDDDSDEVKAIIEKALADIETATSADAVEAIASAAEKNVADQRAAEEAAKALAEAKEEAKAAVEALASDDDSDEVVAIIEKALADIETAENEAAVEAIIANAEKAVADQKAAEVAAAALAEAKEDAKVAVEALAADGDSDEVTAIIEKALADIEDAENEAAVEAIIANAEKAVAEQKAAEEAAAASLAKAKTDAITTLNEALTENSNDEIKAVIERAIEEVNSADSEAAVKAIVETATEDIQDILDKQNNSTGLLGLIKRVFEKLVNFFKSIIAKIKALFNIK